MKYLVIPLFVILLVVELTITSCRKNPIVIDGGSTDTTTYPVANYDTIATYTKDTTFANAIIIKFSGTMATVINPYSAAGVTSTINGGDVVITATTTSTEYNYVLQGNVSGGSVKIYSDYKFNLNLNGASIINNDGPAINIQSSKKITVYCVPGTINRLIDSKSYAASTEDQKGTFFSEGQLNFTGNGKLTIIGNNKHGIVSDGYINIATGNLLIQRSTSDGIHADDYFKMSGGIVKIDTAGGDGIDCEGGYIDITGGDISINSVDDAVTAFYSGTDATIKPYINITGGTFNLNTTGAKGNGIKSMLYTTINNPGTLSIKVNGNGSKGINTSGSLNIINTNATITTSGNAYYDTGDLDIAAPAGINCDSTFTLTGGTITINSSGIAGKGVSVDGNSLINGGTLNINTSGAKFTYLTTTVEAKAFKTDGTLTVNGGAINISSADDGIKSDASVTINGGTIVVSKSYEGIEAPYITITNGNLNIVATNDGINCTKGTVSGGTEQNDGSLLTISGGVIATGCTSGDAVDCNGNTIMTGGTLIAQGPSSQPELALDYNGTFLISGGLLIGSGPSSGNMIEGTSTTSNQYAALIKITGNISAGTLLTVQDAGGNNLITYSPLRTAYYFVFSSPALTNGGTYKIITGGTYSNGTNTNGYYTGGAFSGGTIKGSFTINSKLTSVSM